MEVQQQYGDQVTFIGVPGLSDISNARGFVDGTGSQSIPAIDDNGGEIWDRFDVRAQRTYVYINDDGTFRQAGYGNLENDVRDLIAQ